MDFGTYRASTRDGQLNKGNLPADRVKHIKPAFCSLDTASFCCPSVTFSSKRSPSVLARYHAAHGRNAKGCCSLPNISLQFTYDETPTNRLLTAGQVVL